jgi:uncharacterized protein (TIGR00255 family)
MADRKKESGGIASMTGYARAEGSAGAATWVWEVKSVNGRGLDVRCRLGNGFDRLEPAVRERAAAALSRGSISVSLTYTRSGSARSVTVNQDLVRQILAAAAEVSGGKQSLSLDSVFAIPGVVEVADPIESDEDRERTDAALIADLDRAFANLNAARRAEGARLKAVLVAQVDEIVGLGAQAAHSAAAQPAAIRQHVQDRIAALVGEHTSLSADRLAQEAALLAIKADVREELDRLTAHAEAGRDLLNGGGAVGRRLDFLAQEFAREANTLCAKSSDGELTRVGLALKAVIDRFREQVQNLE